jgi:hypothetical protein
MRTPLLALVPALLLFHAASARADEPLGVASDDESIGTKPARSATPQAAPEAMRPSSSTGSSGSSMWSEDPSVDQDQLRARRAAIASDPPPDWAVLHAGLRPRLGTFGGIATFAAAHARTERFYGGFSLSAVRNDAGTHIGAAQIALGRNLSDTFGGGMQLSIGENRARTFIGLGQVALAYNRSLSFNGITQIAAYNRAKSFTGLVQLGPYNRTDESFAGVAEIGLYDHSHRDFSGLVQVGVVAASGPKVFGDFDDHDRGRKERFAGLAQIGALSTTDGNFYGVTQVGGGAFTSGNFRGLVQLGALGAGAGSFHGLAQIGTVALSRESIGFQIGGAAISTEDHTGLQIGAAGTWAKSVTGGQIGVVNLAEKVNGVQIGLVNHAKSLRGVQIGLANHATDGVLPWTALLNMGFGDGTSDHGGDDDDDTGYAKSQARR